MEEEDDDGDDDDGYSVSMKLPTHIVTTHELCNL
jgi:hypothetical protein